MLISDAYRALNAELHERNPEYGTTGAKWSPVIAKVAESYGARSILDYGSGKGTMGLELPHRFDVREYDPAVPGRDAPPEAADMVVCTDVLEHIEPECLDHVLFHIRGLTRVVAFLVVATRPAEKTLADGRNAHLIIKPAQWWLPHLLRRWNVDSFKRHSDEFFLFVGYP